MADEWLIFVDTNIYLDFYRLSGESAKRQMEALERHKERLIISEQVRMEFLKNRQKVILKSFEGIRKPAKTTLPQIIMNLEPGRLLRKSEDETVKRYKQIETRIENLLGKPGNYDEVYKSFNRIFKSNTLYNLKRPDKVRFEVRNRARKRFCLGYPPRKPTDTSIGDALNWEWIVHCATNAAANQHVLIVSRDGDFGAQFGKTAYLNDWLKREFKERISQHRKIELTTKLTVALKRLDETVKVEDEEEEQNLLEEITSDDIERYLSSLNMQSKVPRSVPDVDLDDLLG